MKKTLLFGNGFNRLAKDDSQYSWETLLRKLEGEKEVVKNEEGKCFPSVPNTLIYEKVLLSQNDFNDEEHIKNIVISVMKKVPSNDVYKEAIRANFDEYITTNYDDAFAYSLYDLGWEDSVSDNSEKIYSIRRYSSFEKGGRNLKLWHMHGKLSNYKSIQLGLDHYAGSVGKIDSYLKGHYEHIVNGKPEMVLEIEEKHPSEEKQEIDRISWIDLFFDSNVHIVGLGLDYSEIDLWWVLNKRARLKKSGKVKIDNSIVFYANSDLDIEKQQLLESFDVEVVHAVCKKNESNETDYKKGILEALDIASKT